MSNSQFNTITHAKCILAGEHAVLRGHPSVVFPVKCKTLELTYQPANRALNADFSAPYGENLLIFLWRIVAISLQMLDKDSTQVEGQFYLKNSIPMGCGLGFSSALCVAITQWLIWQGWLEKQELFNFARALEDHFHGKSSGVDIVGALTNTGVIFDIKDGFKDIELNWVPFLYISSSDHHCSTEKCIRQVENLRADNPTLADTLDNEMAASVMQVINAFKSPQQTGFDHLASAINKANNCFKEWGLITPMLDQHMETVLTAGAVAAKPTGSGGGGYVLSLWHEPPKDPNILKILRPLF